MTTANIAKEVRYLACEMEAPVSCANDLALTLALFAETLDENEAKCVNRLANLVMDQAGKIEEFREKVLHLTRAAIQEIADAA